MPPTFKEAKAYMDELQTKAWAQRQDMVIPAIRSAALSAEKLLGDPHWDRYLMKCQALLNEATAARTDWMVKCTRAVSENDRIVAQWNYHACDARVTTLTEVMGIPKELMDAYRSELGGDGRPVDGTGNTV